MLGNPPRPIESVSNTELYNRWSKVYDTDGNILQLLDDEYLPPLLSSGVSHLHPSGREISVTELGTGTGRSTQKLLNFPSVDKVTCLDLSPSMLELAKQRLVALSDQPNATVVYHVFDAFKEWSAEEEDLLEGNADMVLSTLVLEHLPLDVFFGTVKRLLKKEGGVLVLTNMHPDMGGISQAGFLDTDSNVKVRGTSYIHKIEDVTSKAEEYGFKVEGKVDERGVNEGDVGREGKLGDRGRKWVGVKCWFGLVLRVGNEGKP